MESITIHHPPTGNVATVPRSVFDHGLKAKGWKEGPVPSPKREKPAKQEDDE